MSATSPSRTTTTPTEHTLERAFLAAAEATEEAVLNSLTAASPVRAADGTLYDSLSNWL